MSLQLIKHSIAAFVFMSFVTGCSDNTEQHTPPPPAVSVIEVKTQEVGNIDEYVARTEAFRSVALRARVEGTITKRLFTEGEVVEKGQLLFEIDRESYEAAFRQADANLFSAITERERTKRDYERGLELRPNGFISQSDLDTLASNARKAESAVVASEATVQNAKVNLEHTRIRAPFSGRISAVRYSVGNLVGPNSDPLATLLQDDPIYANMQVDESSYITRLQAFIDREHPETLPSRPKDNQFNMTLVLPNGTRHKYPGTITYADIEANPTTGTIMLRAEFPNPSGIVRPGLYGTLLVEENQKSMVPVVPQYAVQQDQQGYFVLVVDEKNTVRANHVELGRTIGPMWVVESGLEEGRLVIVEGLQKVRTGAEVTPVVKLLDTQTGALSAPPKEASTDNPTPVATPSS